MITESRVSQSTQKITAIIENLQNQPHVQTAVLCTADGLPVHGQESKINHMAAVAGFLLSAARQSSNMLGYQSCHELYLQLSHEDALVFRPFIAGQSDLILTILINKKAAYKHLIAHTVSSIQQAVEE